MDWKLLEIHSSGHYGFGSYDAGVWLVGPGAKGLGTSAEETEHRLGGWHRRGQREMDDLYLFHAASGDIRWFGTRPQVDRTWSRLSRFTLAMNGQRTSDESVRAYQSEQLGRLSNKDVCMVNLLTANASSKPWPFALSRVAYLSDPDRFVDQFLTRRTRHIRSRLARHKPRLVVFYDRTHVDIWSRIAGVSFSPTELPSCHAAQSKDTLFMLLRHPESVGTTNRYFEEAGKLAARLMAAETEATETT